MAISLKKCFRKSVFPRGLGEFFAENFQRFQAVIFISQNCPFTAPPYFFSCVEVAVSLGIFVSESQE
jgi:hypothetical protein